MQKVFLNLLFFLSPILKFKVEEESMKPLFNPQDIIFIYRFAYIFADPKEKDIIVFRSPIDGKYLIKQIKKIDNKKYFVVGTNAKSIDSRKFGWIKKEKIVGKVLL